MTATLNTLESRGLIEGRSDPGDGRRYIVTLSEAGQSGVRVWQEQRHRWLAQALHDHLSPSELVVVIESIALLAGAIEA